MERVLQIGDIQAAPGEKAKGYLTVAWLCDASPVEVPVMLINGQKPGVCLWIQGGNHGNEYVGPMAIQDLYHTDPKDISGALVLLPVINVLAFRAGTRGAPQDGLDMNRIWPGKSIEQAMHIYAHSEIVVHTLVQYMNEVADAAIDCHSGGSPHLMSPYAQFFVSEDLELAEKCRGMAISTGLPLIWETVVTDYAQKAPGSVSTFLNKVGKPSITVEVGGQGRVFKEDKEIMLSSLQGVAQFLQILSGNPRSSVKQRFVSKGNWLRASRGGLLNQLVAPLEQVEKGKPMAQVFDLYGRILEEIISPADGVVIGHRTRSTVNTGEYVCNVGELREGGD
jgi:predicted deacylase